MMYQMWEHRNITLHAKCGGMNPITQRLLENEIAIEWNIGQDLITENDRHIFFRKSLANLLKCSSFYKISWLTTLWCTKDSSIGPSRKRNGTLILQYKKWKMKLYHMIQTLQEEDGENIPSISISDMVNDYN